MRPRTWSLPSYLQHCQLTSPHVRLPCRFQLPIGSTGAEDPEGVDSTPTILIHIFSHFQPFSNLARQASRPLCTNLLAELSGAHTCTANCPLVALHSITTTTAADKNSISGCAVFTVPQLFQAFNAYQYLRTSFSDYVFPTKQDSTLHIDKKEKYSSFYRLLSAKWGIRASTHIQLLTVHKRNPFWFRKLMRTVPQFSELGSKATFF